MSVALSSAEIPLTSEVRELAARLGVAAELPKVLEMTREVFPNAAVEINVDADPEIAKEVCLAVVVRTEVSCSESLVRGIDASLSAAIPTRRPPFGSTQVGVHDR